MASTSIVHYSSYLLDKYFVVAKALCGNANVVLLASLCAVNPWHACTVKVSVHCT